MKAKAFTFKWNKLTIANELLKRKARCLGITELIINEEQGHRLREGVWTCIILDLIFLYKKFTRPTSLRVEKENKEVEGEEAEEDDQ